MPELLRPAILELLSTLFAKAMFNGSQKINYHRRNSNWVLKLSYIWLCPSFLVLNLPDAVCTKKNDVGA